MLSSFIILYMCEHITCDLFSEELQTAVIALSRISSGENKGIYIEVLMFMDVTCLCVFRDLLQSLCYIVHVFCGLSLLDSGYCNRKCYGLNVLRTRRWNQIRSSS